MEIKPKYLGITGRLVIIFSSLIIAITIISTVISVKEQQDLVYNKLLIHSHQIGSLLKEGSINFLDNYDVGQLRNLLATIIDDPDVVYCYIFDEEGAILTDGTNENSLRDQILSDRVSINSIAAKKTLEQFTNGILDITNPIYLGTIKIGGVRIGRSMSTLDIERKKILKRSIQTGLIFLIFAVLVAVFVAKRITRPLLIFLNTIKLIKEGSTDKYTNIRTRDEIGLMSQAFDQMIKELRATTASKKELDLEIKKRIATEEDLRKSNIASLQANKAKSEFLANMSHEIRTPMNGILGMGSLLIDTELNEEQIELAENINKSTESLLVVINDILDFSKIEAGKLDLENINFDLRTMIENVTDVLAINAHEKSLELSCLIYHDVPTALIGDPGRLRQILMNLVGNALKFTAKGEVTICVSLEKENETTASIHFEIVDTGIGISQQGINKLFQTFSQVDSSTTRKFGGTGLGLTISKKLTELMNGSIGVKSKEGFGSTFWFTVVFNKQSCDMDVRTKILEDIKGKMILVVDHYQSSRKVIEQQLKLSQCEFLEADSYENALEVLYQAASNKQLFDVVIINKELPHKDGETLGKMIKQSSEFKNVILILLAATGQRGDAARVKKIGFAAYLTKPIKQSHLHECLRNVLGVDNTNQKQASKPFVTKHSISEAEKNNVVILLVEDNIINQKVANKVLNKIGYQVDIANNGLEAVNAVEKNNYDLVLMDGQMPVMDGLEATKIIRKKELDSGNKQLPIIALTAHAMKGDREKFLAAGMNDYLTKPIIKDALIDIVNKVIGDHNNIVK